MPTRLVREGLLDSQRYWSVTIEARQLFWHLMLLADDLGCVSLAPAFVRRRCFDDGPTPDRVNLLLGQLSDADLVRIYDVDGARFGFIPRFAQRLKRITLRHPEPPTALLVGDQDAQKKFKQISQNAKNPAAAGGPMAAPGRPEVEVEVEKIKSSGDLQSPAGGNTADPCPHQQIVDLYHQTLPTGLQVRVWSNARASTLRTRWREDPKRQDLDWWRRFFEHIAKSDFLMGKVCSPGRKPFQIDLEWIIKEANFAKIIEGKYDMAAA